MELHETPYLIDIRTKLSKHGQNW